MSNEQIIDFFLKNEVYFKISKIGSEVKVSKLYHKLHKVEDGRGYEAKFTKADFKKLETFILNLKKS